MEAKIIKAYNDSLKMPEKPPLAKLNLLPQLKPVTSKRDSEKWTML